MTRRIAPGILLGLLASAATATAQSPATQSSPNAPATLPATLPATQPSTRPALWSQGKPTPLTITVNADNAAEAASQLSRQLGMPVSIVNQSAAIHYVGTEKPYAAALGDFFEKSGLVPFEGGSGLTLSPGTPLSVSAMNDLCTIVVSRIACNASRSYLQPGRETSYSYSVQGLIVLDPSLRVLGVSQNATVEKADLSPVGFQPNGGGGFDSYAVYRALSDQTSSLRLSFNFNTTQAVTKINFLAGRLKAWRVVDEASVDVSFEQIAQGLPVEGKGVTAAVSVDPQAGRQGAVNVVLTGPAVELYKDDRWQQGMTRTVSATDVDGALMPINVYNSGRILQARRRAGAGNNPQPDKEKDKPTSITLTVRGDMRNGMQASEFFDLLTMLRVRIPTKLKAIDLPFEIRNVVLVPEQK